MTAKVVRAATNRKRRTVEVLRTGLRNLAGDGFGVRRFGLGFERGQAARNRIGYGAHADSWREFEDDLGRALGRDDHVLHFADEAAGSDHFVADLELLHGFALL